MKAAAGGVRVGIGGWTYAPWRGGFYPADLPRRRELEYASRKLTTIEINGTYYGSQKPESFAKWFAETPDDFVFSVKGSRYTTNRRVLAAAGPSIERFFASGVLELKEKLGPINWQFMPTKKFDPADFESFLKLLPPRLDGKVIRHAVEVRHASFATAEFVALTRQYGVAIVTAADAEFPQIADPTTDFVYARIMGTAEAEADGYGKKAIAKWAKAARDWAAGKIPKTLTTIATETATPANRDVFLYVISGFKERNPRAAMAILAELG